MLPANSLFPIHDENPTRTFSFLAALLIAMNVFIFFFMQPQTGRLDCQTAQFFYRWGVVPREITANDPLSGEIPGGENCSFQPKSVWGSLFTSMFLHGDLFHLGGNMLFLWVFGNNIEDALGKVRFLIFYLATGIAASFAHIFTNASSAVPTIGASGAISGLLGAYLVLYPRAQIKTLVFFVFITMIRLPAMLYLGIWFISQFFIGAGQRPGAAGVAWMAHVGGFVAGALLIMVLGGRKLGRRQPAYY